MEMNEIRRFPMNQSDEFINDEIVMLPKTEDWLTISSNSSSITISAFYSKETLENVSWTYKSH